MTGYAGRQARVERSVEAGRPYAWQRPRALEVSGTAQAPKLCTTMVVGTVQPYAGPMNLNGILWAVVAVLAIIALLIFILTNVTIGH